MFHWLYKGFWLLLTVWSYGMGLKTWEIPNNLIVLMRNPYTRQEITRWNRLAPGQQRSKTSPYLLSLFIPLISWVYIKKSWTERKCIFKTGGRKSNNWCNADDTTMIAEHANNQQTLIMKIKDPSGKKWDRLNIKKDQTNEVPFNSIANCLE